MARSPSITNLSKHRSPTRCIQRSMPTPSPACSRGDLEVFGTADDYPYVATTYRLTEHFRYWSKHCRINAILQPQQFVEIGEALAKAQGINNGDPIKVRSNRGQIIAVAVVTKQIGPPNIHAKVIHP